MERQQNMITHFTLNLSIVIAVGRQMNFERMRQISAEEIPLPPIFSCAYYVSQSTYIAGPMR